ncbi:hypothetical protein L6452_17968 [Arctium lappa]|uniref:Uncharacterized protein n=1 Tax=Arctium lappa TaxID=4217 RepID=A0ACB9C505_ARCLA|nr:hypothetical protein L6452_17968 [Arctium lappa]
MEKFKEALIKFAHSNPSLFPNDATNNTYSRLIEQRFSQFFPDLRIPNHPPYAAMIHRAIWELKEKGGSSEESISEHIKREYVDLPWAHSTLLKHHLEKLCDRKEIRMTHKQSYLLGGADSDPISSSRSEKPLKRKQNSELGKKSSRHRKKQKSRPDSESVKTSNRQNKKSKKKKEHKLGLLDTNKQIVEVVQEKVFREQDQVLQPLDEMANEQENIIHNGLCEPQYLEIENGTFEKGNSLINIFVQAMEGGRVPANPMEQNQSEIGKDNVGEKVYMSTHFDDTGNENQSVELANDKDQIEIQGTKKGKLKRKKRLKSLRRNNKRGKKHEINEETQIQTLSEATLKQHCNVTEGNSDEQNQMIEVNMTDILVNYENVVGKSVDAEERNQLERMENGVAEYVGKDGETKESSPDNSGYISFGQIQMKQNPQLLQLEKSPNSNPILLKSKHPGKRVLTRSQIKTISKKDASVCSELMRSPGYAYVPNDEYLPEEAQQVIETKQVPSAVSTQMNGQRAKLRSSQKNTGHLETEMALAAPSLQMESQQKSISPSLEKPLKELLNPTCTKLRLQFPDLDEPATEVQEPDSSQQDQQPDALEARPRYKGRGRPPKYNGHGRHPAAISKKGQQSAEKCKVRSRHPKPNRVEDKSTDFIQKVKHSHVKKGQHKYQDQQPNEEDKAKYNGHGRHKMMRRSIRKKKDSNR